MYFLYSNKNVCFRGEKLRRQSRATSRFDPVFFVREEERIFHLRLPDNAVRRLFLGAVLLFQLSVSECFALASVLLDERSIELVLTTPLTDCKLEALFR